MSLTNKFYWASYKILQIIKNDQFLCNAFFTLKWSYTFIPIKHKEGKKENRVLPALAIRKGPTSFYKYQRLFSRIYSIMFKWKEISIPVLKHIEFTRQWKPRGISPISEKVRGRSIWRIDVSTHPQSCVCVQTHACTHTQSVFLLTVFRGRAWQSMWTIHWTLLHARANWEVTGRKDFLGF